VGTPGDPGAPDTDGAGEEEPPECGGSELDEEGALDDGGVPNDDPDEPPVPEPERGGVLAAPDPDEPPEDPGAELDGGVLEDEPGDPAEPGRVELDELPGDGAGAGVPAADDDGPDGAEPLPGSPAAPPPGRPAEAPPGRPVEPLGLSGGVVTVCPGATCLAPFGVCIAQCQSYVVPDCRLRASCEYSAVPPWP
jgi:hypothetical protein